MALSIGKAWDETRAFLSRERRLVVPVSLALFAIPAAFSQWWVPYGTEAPLDRTPVGIAFTILLYLMAYIGQLKVTVLAIGWSGSLAEALAKAARRLWIVVAANLIVVLPIVLLAAVGLGLTLPPAVVINPSELTASAIENSPPALAILAASTMLFFFLIIRLIPMNSVAMVESSGPIALIGRSWALAKWNFWRLFVILILFGIATTIVEWAISTVLGSVLTVLIGRPTPFSLSALLVALPASLGQAFFAAALAAISGRIFVQLTASQSNVPDVKRAE